MTLTYNRKADENGNLYGSVTEFDIVESIKEKGVEINRNNVNIEKHIKEIGDSEVVVSFGSDLTTTVQVSVVKEEI
jgi:large subunit ribosomal protein L9